MHTIMSRNFRTCLLLILSVFVFLQTNCKSGRENKGVEAPSKSYSVNSNPDLGASIHEAAMKGDLVRISQLLERGCNVDTLDQDGRTALIYAAYNGNTNLLRLLIQNGASVNLQDINGSTALMMASSGPYPDAVKLLLDNQADPNITDRNEHFSALMYASSEGQLEVAKILLEYKADPFLKDIDGVNALNFAKMNNHPEVAALLKSFMEKSQEK